MKWYTEKCVKGRLSACYIKEVISITRLCSFRSCLFDCQAALKIRPCYPKAQARAAQCCMFLQRYDECITLCDKMLLASPTDKVTLELRARAVAGKVSSVQQDSQKLISLKLGGCSSVVVKVLFYKPEGRGFETRWVERIFSIYLILPATPGPGVYSASNRKAYQKQKNNVSGE
jgi:hypothetical protein